MKRSEVRGRCQFYISKKFKQNWSTNIEYMQIKLLHTRWGCKLSVKMYTMSWYLKIIIRLFKLMKLNFIYYFFFILNLNSPREVRNNLKVYWASVWFSNFWDNTLSKHTKLYKSSCDVLWWSQILEVFLSDNNTAWNYFNVFLEQLIIHVVSQNNNE